MLKRIWSLFVGIITFGLVKFEESNPEILFAKLGEDINKQLVKTKEKMIDLKVNLKVAEKQMEKAKTKIDSLQGAINQAISAKDEDLLIQLYIQEKEYQKTYEMSKKLYDDLKVTSDKAEADYKLFKMEMESKKIKIEGFKAQAEVNKMRKGMIKAISLEFGNLDTDRAEKLIEKQTFEVEARQDIEDDTVENKIKRMTLGAEMEEARARARVALQENDHVKEE